MAFDPGAILQLPTVVRGAVAAGQTAGRPLRLSEPAPFDVAFVGPVDGGKTALVHTLLGASVYEVPVLAERPGRDTTFPVEYVLGSTPKLLLGFGSSGGSALYWVEGRRDDLNALRHVDLRRVRVELPSPILAEWNIRILDYPSIEGTDELAAEQFEALWQQDTGVLYIVPGRGLSDADFLALESLRRKRVVVIENLREEELLPTRSLLQPIDLPTGLSCPFVVPIMAFQTRDGQRNQGNQERELLRKCVALLRADSLPRGHFQQLRQVTEDARSELRREMSARLAEVYAVRDVRNGVEQLHALVGALALERDAHRLEPLDSSLTDLMHSVERSDATAPGTLRKLLRDDVAAAIDRYNIEAGRRSIAPSNGPKPRSIDFGTRYVEAREELTSFLRNILDNVDELDLTQAERESISALVSSVHDDRFEVAMLGRFSSGKSSLINALLGVPVDDRAPKLLPTSVRPETATVNRLEYADGAMLREVSWLDKASLTFLSETGDGDQLRVHVDEVIAFHSWLQKGEVTESQCSFDFASFQSQAPTSGILGRTGVNPLRAFEKMWSSLRFPNAAPRFVYPRADRRAPKLPDDASVVRVEVRRFEKPVPNWPKAPTLQQAFDAVKDPAVAARVGCLHVGFDHPLLRHASIIDTPGTDAPIPHHRRVARQIIKDKGCPVIYCFLGASGEEDRRNLQLLSDWGIGKTDLKRFFFVITQRGIRHSEGGTRGCEEIMRHARVTLETMGIAQPNIYFTEVVQEQNDDFQGLKSDVSRFVTQSGGSLFVSWVSSARQIVADVAGRYERRLLSMAEDERSRVARENQLRSDTRTLAGITADFERSSTWGVAWAQSRVQTVLQRELAEVDGIVDGLTTRKSFAKIKEDLDQGIEDVNDAMKRVVRAVCEGMSGKLKSILAEKLCNRTIEVRPLVTKDNFFPSADVLEAVGRTEWRGRLKKLWQMFTVEWDKDVEVNRERIAAAWRSARKVGIDKANLKVAATIGHLRQELRRISQGIESEIEQCGRREPPEIVETIEKRRKSATTWVGRFDAIERKFQGEARS